MSFTINGIGTHVYGRDKELTREDQCDQCGQFTNLQSYNATNYFVFLFVPIIPLGKIRILDHCSACKRWRQIPLKKWQQAKDDAIRDALQKMRSNPSDPEAVKEALVTATQFQDQGVLLQFKQVADNFRGDAAVQSLLGATMSYFGRSKEAIEAYMTSLEAKDDPEIREQLAVEFAYNDQPEAAEPLLSHIWTPEHKTQIGHAMALVHGYQAKGQHDRALATLDKIASVHPELAHDAEFKRMKKQAEKLQRKGKPVTSTKKTNSNYSESSSSSTIARWIFPAIIALGALWFLGSAIFAGFQREVLLVNGLNQPYVATLNGQDIELQPGQLEHVKVSEGDVTVSAMIQGKLTQEEVHPVKTKFFNRVFGTPPVFIFNPDGTAIITREQVMYSARPNLAEAPMVNTLVGETFYIEKEIDYPFIEPPSEMDLPSESSVVTKLRLSLTPPDSFESDTDMIMQLRFMLEPDELSDYLLRRVEFGADSEAVLGMLANQLGPERTVEVFGQWLDDKPVNINLHRIYQQSAEIVDPTANLLSDYQTRLDADPGNADLMYLVARATEDERAQSELFKKATQANPPSAFAFNALAYGELSAGRYQDGLGLAQKAIELEPDSLSFRLVLTELLESTGDYDRALQSADRAAASTGLIGSMERIALEIPILVAAGKSEEAERTIDALGDRLVSQIGAVEERSAILPLLDPLRYALAYSQGDTRQLSEMASKSELERIPFYALVALNRLDDAGKKFEEAEAEYRDDTTVLLTMYVAAKSQRNEELAKQYLDMAMEHMQKSTREDRIIGQALEGKGDAAPDALIALDMWPRDKRVCLAALALRHPQDFAQYMAAARKLNYKRTSPYLLIKDLQSPSE